MMGQAKQADKDQNVLSFSKKYIPSPEINAAIMQEHKHIQHLF